MIKEQELLPAYIEEQYGLPKTDEEAIYLLQEIFQEQLKKSFLTMSDKEAIAEQYNLLIARGLPAFSWMAQAIHMASKKEAQKQNFRYIVGMLRQWMKWGFGHIPNEEENELADYFEEVTTLPISPDARQVLKTLMGEYGGIRVARMMPRLQDSEDLSLFMAKALSNILQERYKPNAEEN